MAIEVTNLSELDTATVQQQLDFVKQLMAEEYPELDVRRGVFADYVLLPSAQHATALKTEVERARQSSTLQGISEDPTLADDDVVNAVMSNYFITRRVGQRAVGQVTIVVSKLATVTVPAGAVFTGQGKQFTADTAYVAKTSIANVQSSSDRVLNPRGDGTYSFAIEVTASAEGSDYMLKKDTVLVPSTVIVNFVRSYAASDFTDGVNTETNEELITRVQQGLSAKTLSNRTDMYALLAEFLPTVITSSVIGFGDPEMTRDQHSVLPVSLGGRADWYVRTQLLPQRVGLTKTATLISKRDDGSGVWQFGIGRDEVPGFYDIPEIKLPASEVAGSFEITQQIRSIDLENITGELTPDIVELAEGTFSRYQAAVIQFIDDETDTSDLTVNESTQDYAVTIRGMEKIAEVQTMAGSLARRNYGGDVLIRAAVPCFVSLSFTIQGQAGAVLPDPEEIRQALADYVNQLGFNGRLHASALADIIHNYLAGRVAVSAIDMNGEILRPDGTLRRLRSTEVLVIPDEPELFVTSRTTIFVLDPADVSVSAQTVNIPQI